MATDMRQSYICCRFADTSSPSHIISSQRKNVERTYINFKWSSSCSERLSLLCHSVSLQKIAFSRHFSAIKITQHHLCKDIACKHSHTSGGPGRVTFRHQISNRSLRVPFRTRSQALHTQLFLPFKAVQHTRSRQVFKRRRQLRIQRLHRLHLHQSGHLISQHMQWIQVLLQPTQPDRIRQRMLPPHHHRTHPAWS